ncbi:MAG: fructose-bisphosphate aldolase [Candidatus Eremiobacteraeota bacterium]|nr:fructose-bisphosphate aldolase [Candidatus Eremiobacteraeota bacterium]MBV8203714.1 fructose-bisphosphate aldolase [Candidatus Eremiobacteraeota bacterium]MBV8263954.1 fructose-bisphosphate aldolase [Candidatus Eremiobacteraeota bacterium]MBV8669776.1 fructose-bisphosphate aldolase [Candidatus Eremiobacteraeota bacterium]
MLTKVQRPTLDDLALSAGKRARLHRMLYEYGPANGTLLLLPIDQGLEHGPVDFFDNPDSIDPEYEYQLAIDGNYSGIALHFGLAKKYFYKHAGKVPLLLKINGKTNIPSDDEAFSPLTGSVEDAVRLGADAVGYTLYVGSPRQGDDIAQLTRVREDCDRYGMPLVVWSYPRGKAVKEKGGQDSLYAIDYAARVACELGADIVKLNEPKLSDSDKQPKPYPTIQFSEADAIRKVVTSAGRTLVLLSGGSKVGDEDLLRKTRAAMEAGVTGLIFGRNLWQRRRPDALEITNKIQQILKDYSG